jgi:hypothetical protein
MGFSFTLIFTITILILLPCCLESSEKVEGSEREEADYFHIKALELAIKTHIDGYGYLDMGAVEEIIYSVKPTSNELKNILKECEEYAKSGPEALGKYYEIEELCKERGWI